MFAVNRHLCKIAFLNEQLVEEEFGQQFERKERILEQKLRRKKEC
jgi:hypothetical protein